MNVYEACELLGVRGTASPADVKTAYRKISREAHPDRGGSHDLMTRVNLARDILTGKAPSSSDGHAHTQKAPREPLFKRVDIKLSYAEWQSGSVKTLQDPEINRILGKIINGTVTVDIPAYQDLDEPIRMENGESSVDFLLHVDTGHFERRDFDLFMSKSISLYDYIYNRSFFVVHPLAQERMQVLLPKNESFIDGNEHSIVVKGKGFCSHEVRGDMIIELVVDMPDFENLSDKARALLKPGLAEIAIAKK